MKKVFIVTSDDHDDYRIHRVFTDKSKSVRYASLVHDVWGVQHADQFLKTER